MDQKKKFRIVIMVPVLTVLIVLGLLCAILVAGSVKPKPPTAVASAAQADVQ